MSDSSNDGESGRLWTALHMLRNHQDNDSVPQVTIDQAQVLNSTTTTTTSSQPTVVTSSSNVFGISQSMDIDFNVDFSPPHRTIHPSLPSHPSSSRATNPPLQEGHHQVPSSMVSLPQASDGPSSQQYGDQEDESDLVELMETSHRSVLQQQEETEDLINLMESGRQNVIAQEQTRQAKEEERKAMLKEKKLLFKTCRVPGETSTETETLSSEGEVFIEPSNQRIRRKSGVIDQVTPTSVAPIRLITVNRFKQPREAALSTTESESEVVNRPRRVPQIRRCHSQEDSESNVFTTERHYQSVTIHSISEESPDRDRTPPLLVDSQNDNTQDPNVSDDPGSSQPSSSSGNSEQPSGSTTTSQTDGSTTIDRSGSVTTVTTSTSSDSSGLEGSASVGPSQESNNSQSINSQTLAHPLFSSTPNEADLDNTTVIKATPTTSHTHAVLMPPPNHPPIKHSSTEISTSSSGTSGYTIKTKSVTHFEGGPSTSTSQSTESLPLALATPLDNNSQEMHVTNDVIPATPLGEDTMETQDITQSSQDELFQPDTQSIGSSQIPRWITNSQGRTKRKKENLPSSSESESSFEGTKKRYHSNSTSDSSSRKKPLSKRQRLSVTPISPDANEPPKWIKQNIKSYQFHSTPASSNNATPTDSPLVSSTGTSPEISSQSPSANVRSDIMCGSSLSSGYLGSISSGGGSSLSSGYLGSISSGGGSSGFTPPGTVANSREHSLVSTSTSLSKSSLTEARTTEDSCNDIDNTNNNNGSDRGSSDDRTGRCKNSSSSDDSETKRGGGAGAVVIATNDSHNLDADVSAGASSNNTPSFDMHQPFNNKCKSNSTSTDKESSSSSNIDNSPLIEGGSVNNSLPIQDNLISHEVLSPPSPSDPCDNNIDVNVIRKNPSLVPSIDKHTPPVITPSVTTIPSVITPLSAIPSVTIPSSAIPSVSTSVVGDREPVPVEGINTSMIPHLSSVESVKDGEDKDKIKNTEDVSVSLDPLIIIPASALSSDDTRDGQNDEDDVMDNTMDIEPTVTSTGDSPAQSSFLLRLSPSQVIQSCVSSSQTTKRSDQSSVMEDTCSYTDYNSEISQDVIDLTGTLSDSTVNEPSQDINILSTPVALTLDSYSLQDTIDLTSPCLNPMQNTDHTIVSNSGTSSEQTNIHSQSTFEPLAERILECSFEGRPVSTDVTPAIPLVYESSTSSHHCTDVTPATPLVHESSTSSHHCTDVTPGITGITASTTDPLIEADQPVTPGITEPTSSAIDHSIETDQPVTPIVTEPTSSTVDPLIETDQSVTPTIIKPTVVQPLSEGVSLQSSINDIPPRQSSQPAAVQPFTGEIPDQTKSDTLSEPLVLNPSAVEPLQDRVPDKSGDSVAPNKLQSAIELSFEGYPDEYDTPTGSVSRPVYESIQYSTVDDTPPLSDHTSMIHNSGNELGVSESPLSGPFQFRLPVSNSIGQTSRITPSQSSSILVESEQATPSTDHMTTPSFSSRVASDKQAVLSTDQQANLPHNQSAVPPSDQSVTPPLVQVATPPTRPPIKNTKSPLLSSFEPSKKKRRKDEQSKKNHSQELGRTSQHSATIPEASSHVNQPPSNECVSVENVKDREEKKNTKDVSEPIRPLISPFVLGSDTKDGQEDVNLDDSQNFVMPIITGMEDSEQESALNTSFAITNSDSQEHQFTASNMGTGMRTNIAMEIGTRTNIAMETGTRTNIAMETGMSTNIRQSLDTSEDPFEFNSNHQEPFVIPLRRKRKGLPLPSARKQPTTSTSVPVNNSQNKSPPIITSSNTSVLTTPTNNYTPNPSSLATPTSNKSVRFNPLVSSTPPYSHSPCSTPRVLNQSNPVISLDTPSPVLPTPPVSVPPSTPVSFSSPSAFVQPQAIESLSSSHPNARYIRLNHVTTVTTVRQFVSTELIETSSGNIIETCFNEIPSDQHTQVSFQAEPFLVRPPLLSSQSISSSFVNNTSFSAPSPTPTGISGITPRLVSPTCMTGSIPANTGIPVTPTPSIPVTPFSPVSFPQTSAVSHTSFNNSSLEVSKDSTSLASSSNSSCSVTNLVPGLLVIARWRDRKWYAAKLVKRVGKKICVDYLDNDRDNVAAQHILPLSKVPVGTLVLIGNEDDDHFGIERSGSYVDHDPETNRFRIETRSGKVISHNLKQLILTSETALMAVKIASSNEAKETSISNIFSGYIFMLTDQRKEQSEADKRDVIEEIIKVRGGLLMNEYKPTRVLDKKTFCLSNTHCRTVKYFIALVVNLPCVKYDWIKECVRQNRFISHESYLLPAGISTVNKQVVKWNPRPKQFLQVSIFIHGIKSFKDFWEKVCSAGGANILSRAPTKTRMSGEVFIVLDSNTNRYSIPHSLIDLKGAVHLLTSDWLVESLLQGSVVNTKQFEL